MRDFRPGRRFRAARVWSNQVLRQIAPHLGGDVLNVSGWRDEDKQGGYYRDYFTSATSYGITNFGDGFRGELGSHDLALDLEVNLPSEFHGLADVVFNHTTLEHVFDVFKAVRNLCLLSRDVVIVVVPAIQEEHATSGFGDFWRFMSGGLRRLFETNGLTPVLLVSSPYRDCAVYHLLVASRYPERWREAMLAASGSINDGKDLFRESLIERIVYHLRHTEDDK